jgi:hypothetical protein
MLIYGSPSEWFLQARLLPLSRKGGFQRSSTARVERPPLYRGGSASTEDYWKPPLTPHAPGAVDHTHFPNLSFHLLPLWGWPGRIPNLRASNEGHLILSTSLKGSGQGCPLLRASNEHILIVRVLRARRAPGRFLPPISSFTSPSSRLACLDFHCACRTSTF